jgi:23S rRNA pseudouridine1911/1915/1917 synthase
VSPGEVIQVTLPREPPQDAVAEKIPLEIVYEDEHLLVVNKPAGMVIHPAYGHSRGTLVNALLHHCNHLSSVNGPTRPGVVHRLDKDTTGLLVVAKSDAVHASLSRQFSRRTVEREYEAIVWGVFKEKQGTVEAQLGRSRSDRKRMAVVSDGKAAITHYTVLERFRYLSLVRLKLGTGRTHQIRVHLAHIHHPVLGDPGYGGRQIIWGSGLPGQRSEVQKLLKILGRQALHARTLGFLHPVSGHRVTLDSPLPPDMLEALSLLRQTGSSD